NAIAAAPLLLSPLLGLARAPAPWILLVLAFSIIVLRLSLERSRATKDLFLKLASVGAPWSLVSIVMTPLGLRDLASVNHGEHEAFHLGWINSVLHGKLMLADTGLIHGPLREYLLIAGLLPFGIDQGHVRIGFVAVNLIGVALLLHVSWH